ncbi:tRNA s(4)U8 sulfurtransferase [Erysipelotrichaceae bacterium]|nr:tRNA s(4)U8 sulfurtransferase [Erysipelotrichaceae bacterium]
MYSEILIRYGELMIKGKNRKKFIKMLENRLEEVFPEEQGYEIDVMPTRAYLKLEPESNVKAILEKLGTIFGTSSVSLAVKVPTELKAITEAAIKIAQEEISDTASFKVETKRSYKPFPLESNAVSRHVAGAIFKTRNTPLKVDVYKPDVQLLIEIRKEFSYVMLDKIKMPGGLPQRTSGKGLLMLSGGIDSPVAGYLAMRKGIELACIHFASPPYTSEKSLEKVESLNELLEKYQKNIPLYVVPFTEIQLAITASRIQPGYHMIIMRRMMYRIAQKIAELHGYNALINGESVGQVASQTLGSMKSTHIVVDLPILQPLAMHEKIEIISIAESIGTYEVSILPYEDCCTIFVPKSPTTNPNLYITQNQEKLIDVTALLDSAVENTKLIEKTSNNQSFL